jgi:hypothetical protein
MLRADDVSALEINLVQIARHRVQQPAVSQFALPYGLVRLKLLHGKTDNTFEQRSILAPHQPIDGTPPQCLSRQLHIIGVSLQNDWDAWVFPLEAAQVLQRSAVAHPQVENDNVNASTLQPLKSLGQRSAPLKLQTMPQTERVSSKLPDIMDYLANRKHMKDVLVHGNCCLVRKWFGFNLFYHYSSYG